jgi:uncharacterized protein YmfQ (DUF2313 family)
MTNFEAHTLEEQRNALAQYFPNDKVFSSKNFASDNLYKLLLGFSGESQRVDEIYSSVWQGTDILTTTDINYIEAWEGAVGIPDDVFIDTTQLTIDERRNQILLKLRSLGVLTKEDFINLALLLGQTITIEHGTDLVFPPYTPPFIPMRDMRAARFVMIVKGMNLDVASYPEYTPPFIPTAPASQLRSLFEILKPSMTIIIFLNSN